MCGSVRFADVPAEPSSLPAFGGGWSDVDLSAVEGEAGFFDGYEWFVADRSEVALTLFGLNETLEEDPPYGYANFQREAGWWIPVGWGQCRIELSRPGWGNARFVLDPAVQPDASASTVSVLATEMACAGGQPPGDRRIRAVVLSEDETAVSVVMLVESPEGAQDCQGNPTFSFEIELGSPLADRAVFDASVQPPMERPWPPTDSSLDSGGLRE